jgi:phenylalanine-4-hydroxylase
MTTTEIHDAPHAIVHLDPDHPGFRDAAYRARRDEIARLATGYVSGDPIPDAPYTADEHALWREIWTGLDAAHERHACAEYLACKAALDLSREHIPQLGEVSRRVERSSGFRLEPVAGLVEPREFLASLANGVFLSTQYIRHHSSPAYTPEPDVVHEVAGHAVTLASERFAELNRLAGDAARRARDAASIERLSRVYWCTIEFGVVREAGGLRAYGAGLLSSASELAAMREAEIRPIDFERMAAAPYDPTTFQATLYAAESFDALHRALRERLRAWR